jgi:MHS family proline/betaine transporter-like MFS transporter
MPSSVSTASKWSMLLGNAFEHYDNALYGLLAPFLAPLFFAEQDPLTALIFTYAIIPLGMLARPFGALFFGYIGDTKGRKQALIISLTGTALSTTFMGFMPTYLQVGWMAPVFLYISRILQNFFAAGETMGGAIYLMENAPESEHNLTSSFYGASTIAGILFASIGVTLICLTKQVENYWRLLYFIGSMTAIFAWYLRIKGNHTVFPKKQTTSAFFQSTCKAFWTMRKALCTIAIASGFSYASYILALVMLNGLIPLVSEIPKETLMYVNTSLLFLDFLLLPVFGLLANRFSRDLIMITAGITAFISGLPLFWLLQGASLPLIILIRVCIVVIGVWFSAPFHAWGQQLIPASHRYTMISLAYALGSQLLGGPTAAVSLWLFKYTGSLISTAWYWMFLGCLSSGMIFWQSQSSKKKEEDLLAEQLIILKV